MGMIRSSERDKLLIRMGRESGTYMRRWCKANRQKRLILRGEESGCCLSFLQRMFAPKWLRFVEAYNGVHCMSQRQNSRQQDSTSLQCSAEHLLSLYETCGLTGTVSMNTVG